MTFVLTTLPRRLIIFGIAAYAADIVFVSNIASLLEGWYIEHLSWHWIFWTAALFTPLMMVCVYFGIPRRPAVGPRPSWRGFTYFSLSLALLYGALDQGERLDWLNSGTIVGMLGLGALPAGCGIRETDVAAEPDPEARLPEHTQHHYPGDVDFRLQVHAFGVRRARARIPRQNSTATVHWRPVTRLPGWPCRCLWSYGWSP